MKLSRINFKQRGIALVVAMLIVAITSVIATEIFYRQQINIQRTLNQVQAERLYQLFLSSEQWAKVVLQQGEIAALPAFEADGAVVKNTLIDQQGCFNLNNLVIKGQANTKQIQVFQNLLRQLQLSPELVWSVVDWIDSNDDPHSEGAEWETYSRLTPAYRAANYRMFSTDELYMMAGWKSADVQRVKKFVCALSPPPAYDAKGRYFPTATISKINVNSASETLLRSLNTEMGSAYLASILTLQKTGGFTSIDLFLKQLDDDNSAEPKLSESLDKEMLTVKSDYFLLQFDAKMDKLEQHYQSLIYRRSETELNTVYRRQFY